MQRMRCGSGHIHVVRTRVSVQRKFGGCGCQWWACDGATRLESLQCTRTSCVCQLLAVENKFVECGVLPERVKERDCACLANVVTL